MKGRRYMQFVQKFRKHWKPIVVCLIAVYVMVTLVQQQIQMGEQKKTMAGINAQIEEAQMENERIERTIDSTSSDEYIEQAARQQLGWVKDGEIVFLPKNGQDLQGDNTNE